MSVPAVSPLFLLDALNINSRGEIVGGALLSTGEVHAFLATPECDEVECEAASYSVTQVSSDPPKVALPEDVRKLLRRQLRFGRFGPTLTVTPLGAAAKFASKPF
jgi:hypothetical protein